MMKGPETAITYSIMHTVTLAYLLLRVCMGIIVVTDSSITEVPEVIRLEVSINTTYTTKY